MLDGMLDYAWTVIDFLERYNGAVTAIATVFIGVFTYVLARVTRRQATLTRQSIDLARDEFNSTHRPKVVIRTIEHMSDGDGEGRLIAQVTYVNAGGTAATITALEGLIITPGYKEPLRPGYSLQAYPVPTGALAGGERRNWAIQSATSIALVVEVGHRLASPREEGAIYFCLGRIEYRDELGRTRETGFCRRFDPANETWIRVEHPDYEYGY